MATEPGQPPIDTTARHRRRYSLLLIGSVILVGLVLIVLGQRMLVAERDRQLQLIATRVTTVATRLQGLTSSARDRTLALRNGWQIAFEALPATLPPAPDPVVSGMRGALPRALTGTFDGTIIATPLQHLMPNAQVRQAWREDYAAIQALGLLQNAFHQATPRIALSYFVSARSGVSVSYPGLTAEALASFVDAAKRRTDPREQPFLKMLSPAALPGRELIWTATYLDPHSASSRIDGSIRGDGRVISLIAPVDVRGRYFGGVGVDLWAEEFAWVIRDARSPEVALTLVDGAGVVITTTQARSGDLRAARLGEVARGGTQARALLGFDPARLPAGQTWLDGQPIINVSVIGSPLRLVARPDLALVEQRALAASSAVLGGMALFYVLLCLAIWQVLRQVFRPAFALADYVQGAGDRPRPALPALWRSTLDTVESAFDAQRESIRQLREAHGTTRAVIDAAFDAVVVADADRHVESANPEAARIFGCDAPAMQGRTIEALLGAGPGAPALEAGRLLTLELVRSDGQSVPAEIQISTIGSDAARKLVVFIRDMTAHRAFEAEVARQREALHQSEKMTALGSLLAGVAHELNNPLAVVVGRSALLLEELGATRHGPAMRKLRDAADRCSRIVKTFLAMARQSGPRRDVVQVNQLVRNALDLAAYGLRTAGIRVIERFDPDLPETQADGDQLVQILINLILNAQHALAGQSPTRAPQIEIVTRHAAGEISVSIADNGPGVPPDIAGRIFDPFFTTKASGEGTGIGLSVSKGMVEAHGGTLALLNRPGEGATFVLTLPVALGALAQRGEARLPSPVGRAAHGRVMVIDDEADIRALVADTLAPLDVTVTSHGDADSALRDLALRRCDIIFCDLLMPGCDGAAFYERLQQADPVQARRVIFISGDLLQRPVAAQARLGERPVIEKPFDPEALRTLVQSMLAQGALPGSNN